MNTTQTYEASSLLGRSDARHDLPTPLFDDCDDGGCNPSDNNETGP